MLLGMPLPKVLFLSSPPEHVGFGERSCGLDVELEASVTLMSLGHNPLGHNPIHGLNSQ